MKAHARVWIAMGLSIAALGSMGSVLAARAVVRSHVSSARRAEIASASDIASTLKLDLQHEKDLIVAAQGFVLSTPTATNAQFLTWARTVHALSRYPELLSIGVLELVPAAKLPAFALKAVHDPVGPLGPGRTFAVVPPGKRPFYCLATLGLTRPPFPATPAGYDACTSALGPALLAARSSGRGSYLPDRYASQVALAIGTPIYRNGSVPATIAARRRAFSGWIGTVVLPTVILASAQQGHPGTRVSLRFGAGRSPVVFANGRDPRNAQRVSIALGNGWTVAVASASGSTRICGNGAATALLFAGLAVSVLLGALLYVLGTSRSRAIVHVRERTEQLRHQALHDSLTGLPNRALILDRIEQMLARSRRSRRPVAVCFIDLDDFKEINDTLGHHAGDQLLVAAANRLSSALRDGDTVGRLGGDEFVVLVDGDPTSAGGEVVAERILDVLRPPFTIADSDAALAVTASIGIAEADVENASAAHLLRDADIALYRAKAAGKARAVMFAPAMHDAVQEHRRLGNDLRSALDNGQYFLLYQPTVDLRTDRATGVEALLRWQHPERGVLEPASFVPELEESGLIVSVGAWVLDEACRQGATWQERGFGLQIAVNVSARQTNLDRIVEDVHGALTRSHLDPRLLVLELTETMLTNDHEGIARLESLKALGVQIAVDDFGTGYSSLSYLRRFPIDIVKIDQSFVAALAGTGNEESVALVHALVQLGKAMGLATVAEGIENHDQRLRCKAEQVDLGQGFLFAKPLAPVELEEFLARANQSPGAQTRA